MIFVRGASCAAVLAVALSVSGCFHESLGAGAPGQVNLSGQWVLDPAASDDALKLIRDATPPPPKPQALPNGGADPCALVSPGSGGGNGGGSSGRGRRGAGAPQSQPACPDSALSSSDSGPRLRSSDRSQFVRSVVVPAEVIEIDQQPERMRIVQGDRHREFEPGLTDPLSVTDRYGSRQIRAGWSGREFVIRSEERNRVSIEERLHAGSAPATLEIDITLKAWNLHKIHARAVYRHVEGAALPLPAADGPPVRGSH